MAETVLYKVLGKLIYILLQISETDHVAIQTVVFFIRGVFRQISDAIIRMFKKVCLGLGSIAIEPF